VADEAVVSLDPAGQHNPPASQGPLDGSADGAIRLRFTCRNRPQEPETAALARYKFVRVWSMWTSRLPHASHERRSWLKTRLKPYWGKPDVRNFREGAGNVMQDLVTICHEVGNGGHIGSH
jgi:hypothetical protein